MTPVNSGFAPAKKANHRVNVVRVPEPRVHTNADTLEIFDIDGYQLVAKKGGFGAGDLAVYVQPDSVVPQTEPFRFIWGEYVGIDGLVPERRRRVTVKKLRGEWSEGLLMPLIDFFASEFPEVEINGHIKTLREGDDVSDAIGITHYDPDLGSESTGGATAVQPRRRYPKTLRGWFHFILFSLGLKSSGKSLALETNFNFPVYDVEALKNFKSAIEPGDRVTVTEKIHGSNARYVFVDGTMYAGSRTQWKKQDKLLVWWKALDQHPEIEEWCRANEGWVLYGEVVPTQGKGFDYGYSDGRVGFFGFDVLDPDGNWIWPGNLGFPLLVPMLAANVPYDESLLKLADGNTLIPGAKHIREGIVIRVLGGKRVPRLGRVHLKMVSNKFLEKDGK